MGRKSRISESSQSSVKLSPVSSFSKKTRRKNSPSSSLRNSTLQNSITESLTTTCEDVTIKQRFGFNVNDIVKGHWWKYISTKYPIGYYLIGVISGLLYFYTISQHFQNLTGFTALTNLEKELSLPTETAFRYSFFKRISEKGTLFEGLRSVIYDERTNGKNITNSFQKYALFPECVLGVLFHTYKNFHALLGHRPDALSKCWQGSSGVGGWEDWKCSGLGDPLTFYLYVNWFIDSIFIVSLSVAGSLTSNSMLFGILSTATFILNHRQIGDWEKLFPASDRFGSYLAIVTIFLVARMLFSKSHPRWTCVVKLAVIINVLIISWPFESQWILGSQLMVTLLLHFMNFLSPYIITIILASHLTGWQYGSLLTLDTSLRCWTFYIYFFVGAILIVYILRPLVDFLFGTKLNNWMFLRTLILILGVYVVATELRTDIRPTFSFHEDPRLGQYLSNKNDSNEDSFFSAVSASVQFPQSKLYNFPNFKTHIQSGEHLWNRHSSKQLPVSKIAVRERLFSNVEENRQSQNQNNANEPSENKLIKSLGIKETRLNKNSDSIVESLEEDSSDSGDHSVTEKWKRHENEELSQSIITESWSESNEDIISHELKSEENTLKKFLASCLFHKTALSSAKLMGDYLLPIIIALLTFICQLFLTLRKLKTQKDVVVRFLPGTTTLEYENASDDLRLLLYYASSILLTFSLTIFIHAKFQLVLLAQMSLLISLFPQIKEFNWLLKRYGIDMKFGRRTNWAIILAILSLMGGIAKLRIDRLYMLPQEMRQGDPAGNEDLIEVIKFIRDIPNRNDLKLKSPNFIGPPYLMTHSYLSTKSSVENHFEDTLPYLTPLLSPQSLLLAELFKKSATIENIHEKLLKIRQPSNLVLFLSSAYCRNPLEHNTESFKLYSERGKLLEDIVDPDEDILTIGKRYLPQRKHRHHNADVLQKYSKITNGNGNIHSKEMVQFLSNDSCCDLINFWDSQSASEVKETITPCFQLLSERSSQEIFPFKRIFQNRLYTLLTWSNEG